MNICKACGDMVLEVGKQYGYDLTIQEVGELLMCCTCYPFGCVQDVKPDVVDFFDVQLVPKPSFKELFDISIVRIDNEMREAMSKLK